jgi:hypothetical protein
MFGLIRVLQNYLVWSVPSWNTGALDAEKLGHRDTGTVDSGTLGHTGALGQWIRELLDTQGHWGSGFGNTGTQGHWGSGFGNTGTQRTD